MHKKFYRKILKNGMTLILEKRDLPIVSIAFAAKTGGMNEDLSEKGISHLIEHMLYKGTPSRSSAKIAEEIEKNGGEINGFTDEAVTAYWCKMPSKKLRIALEVLGDMVKNPLFNEKELEKEKQVIFEEIKMKRDTPTSYIFQEIKKCLYRKPFGSPLIGTKSTLKKTSRKQLVKRFVEVYQPNNMILCVVGDAEFKSLVNFIEKNFGKNRGKNKKIKIVRKNETRTRKRRGIDQANLVLAYHIPLATDKKNYAAFVLNVLMAGGMSSRLFREIREKRNLAYAIKGGSEINKYYAYSYIYAGTKKEKIAEVKKIILEEFRKLSKELSEKELAQAKEQIIGNYQIYSEDSQNQMANLLLSEINGNAFELYKFEKNIRAVKLKDVKALARKIKGKNYSFFALMPR